MKNTDNRFSENFGSYFFPESSLGVLDDIICDLGLELRSVCVD